MRSYFLSLLLLLLCPICAAASAQEAYPLTRDSLEQPNVPKGKLLGPFTFHSSIFAGTSRLYWVYVPVGYRRSAPPNLLVFQDGHRAISMQRSLRLPTVLDNLIAGGDIPPTLGIFVTPGHRDRQYPKDSGPEHADFNPNNRSAEYTTVSDAYSRMLIQELLPTVARSYSFTSDPKRRVIGGTSNGGVAAWTAAWFHPEAFGNVICIVPPFTGEGYRPATDVSPMVVGAGAFPTMIRKEPIRPLKVFIQGAANDLDNENGNSYLSNLQMVSSLEWANKAGPEHALGRARYEVRSAWGNGAHTDKQGGMLLPEVLRWMIGRKSNSEQPRRTQSDK